MPSSCARSCASLSMSQRISRWSDDEADRADEHALDPALRAGRRGGRGCRARATARRSATRSGTRTTSRSSARALGDEARRLQQLVLVRVALGEDPRRQRVRGEDDVRVAFRARGRRGTSTNAGLVVPALDEAQLRAAVERLLELLAVAGDREPRVVRREHEPDDRVGAGRERALGRLGDARRPVLHAGEDRQAELALERRARLLGDRVERVRASSMPSAR